MTLLLIEPDSLLAKNFKSFFTKNKIKVIWRRSMQAAIEKLDKRPVDVVVMDVIGGNHNGVEFLYELRSYPEWYEVPVIFHSSLPPQDFTGLEDSLAELNITSFHYKPNTSLADLLLAVNQSVAAIAA
ncbi:hypothetical protein A3A68_01940 [Candidatus Saccharibacteria bacterium RIFCSPLOWO2_01_FULL_48_13]|nr:MAG: hypothetical protein A3F38_02550 [Candidatus Saccharibacteria bacterium RIFCSPHIGHO2_12_FULL_48_21]OGL36625.1 MAG: hypothetical protein A3A68_01940 [Candidatus Saccharibacteria bacterium RIFCSPLOWO2_01_FULL_48_13]